MGRKRCVWMVAPRNKQVISTKQVCLALAKKRDSASDIDIV